MRHVVRHKPRTSWYESATSSLRTRAYDNELTLKSQENL